MLLCGIEQVNAGMVVGCPINHPKRPDRELLTEGVALDQKMISRLAQLDVRAIWIRHDALADMDHVVGTKLREARENVYQQFRKDISGLQGGTLATGEVLAYRQTVMALICELMGNRHLVGMTDYLFDARNDQFSHGVGVAFLSLLGGLALENYIIEERARLNIEHSRDLTNLGIGGMFHDIGKGLIGQQIADQHEIRSRDGQAPEAPKADAPYADHPQAGYRALRECKINASALTAVLNHHQRFDGSGWPDLTEPSQGRIKGPATGTQIHIFARIVAVANVLDNLVRLYDPLPPVAALKTLQSSRFAGWFDPVVLDTMMRAILPFPIGAMVELSDGSEAAVIAPNIEQPCRPTVRLLSEAHRLPDGRYPSINLTSRVELSIASCAGKDVKPYLFEMGARPTKNASAA